MASASFIARKHQKQRAANYGKARLGACQEQHDFWKDVVRNDSNLQRFCFPLENSENRSLFRTSKPVFEKLGHLFRNMTTINLVIWMLRNWQNAYKFIVIHDIGRQVP